MDPLLQEHNHSCGVQTKALQALLLRALSWVWLVAAEGAELAGECLPLSRLCAQTPHTDPAQGADLFPLLKALMEQKLKCSSVWSLQPVRCSLMIYTGGLVFCSAINLWVETPWTLWELVRFHWCQVFYHTKTSPWLTEKE